METEILIAGTGCSGLYCALNLPSSVKITLITKATKEENDSYLAQGGMCVLKSKEDYEYFFEDTMKAGHYENDKKSVDIMIKSSQDVLADLIKIGVDFQKEKSGELSYTREGAHSDKRIVFHEDITGKEITSHLLKEAMSRKNIEILENSQLIDIVENNNTCNGAVIVRNEKVEFVKCNYVIMATGGVGGLYRHSTNFRHLTGDAIAIAKKHNIELKNTDYVQIHPTTLYSERPQDRSFLISESVRGEGAKLYDKNGNRFVNELLPRDRLTKEIYAQMKKDNTEYVWEDLRTIPYEELMAHFPNIVEHCKKMGYDVTKQCIPVVPAQHYFMGGVKVDYNSASSMNRLYVVGEAACNGVHGKNRLASNSLLESLVFAKRAAKDIEAHYSENDYNDNTKFDISNYMNLDKLLEEYHDIALEAVTNKNNNKCIKTA